MGFNGLITIRGRTSGLPRTTPVAIIDVVGQALGLGPVGRRPVGAQPARRRAARPSRCAAGRKRSRDRAGPDAADRVLPRRPRSGRPRHAVRRPVHPDGRRRRCRRSVGSGRGPIASSSFTRSDHACPMPWPKRVGAEPACRLGTVEGEDRPSASAVRSPARPPWLGAGQRRRSECPEWSRRRRSCGRRQDPG